MRFLKNNYIFFIKNAMILYFYRQRCFVLFVCMLYFNVCINLIVNIYFIYKKKCITIVLNESTIIQFSYVSIMNNNNNFMNTLFFNCSKKEKKIVFLWISGIRKTKLNFMFFFIIRYPSANTLEV